MTARSTLLPASHPLRPPFWATPTAWSTAVSEPFGRLTTWRAPARTGGAPGIAGAWPLHAGGRAYAARAKDELALDARRDLSRTHEKRGANSSAGNSSANATPPLRENQTAARLLGQEGAEEQAKANEEEEGRRTKQQQAQASAKMAAAEAELQEPVSYTHLTLPTIPLV